MNHCPSGRQIAAYLEQTLTAEESWRVEEHLQNCPSCAEAVEELRRINELLLQAGCPREEARIEAIYCQTAGEESEVLSHMRACPRCQAELEAVGEAMTVQAVQPGAPVEVKRIFFEQLSGKIHIPLANIPVVENALPLETAYTHGELDINFQFAGKYSGLSMAITLRERLGGKPLAGLLLRVQSADGKEQIETLTDQAGVAHFALRSLRPSHYSLTLAGEEPTILSLDFD